MKTNVGHTFSGRIFFVAAIYGLMVLVPQYFMEERLNRSFPPALTHPEYFYGFLGVAIAWQCAFLVIARDVQRFRPLILPAVLEKVSFGAAALLLYLQGRAGPWLAGAGAIDLLLAGLFAIAFRASRANKGQPARCLGGNFN